MCYSKKLSISAFLFCLTGSLLLIKYGDVDLSASNKVVAYVCIYVGLVQLMEYFMWSDISCKSGANKISSAIGPLLLTMQPVFMLILASMYLDSSNIIKKDAIIIFLIFYIASIMYKYYTFFNKFDNICTEINTDGHLQWKWLLTGSNFEYVFYHLIFLITFVNFNDFNIRSTLIITYILLLISTMKFKNNIGELWCFMGTSVPLLTLISQKYLR